MTPRILTVGETDDVWLSSTANVDLSAAACEVRTYPLGSAAGAWGAPADTQHPTTNSVRVACRVTNATAGTYVVQSKTVLGPLTIIETGYYWVHPL